MLGRFLLMGTIMTAGMGLAPAVHADVSPTLLIESLPSDNPEYRRMIFVRYLAGDRVNVSYKTFTRSEFKQVPNTAPGELINACVQGSATSLSEIRSFEKAEARLKRSGKTPEAVRFCIKDVSGWESGNRDAYLDPIFNGMPLAPNN